jgi:hypothetical protein
MSDFEATFTAVMAVVTRTLRRGLSSVDGTDDHGDTGAVSIEHVLWYAAAAISVAVVATIIWNQVKSTASTPVQGPSAP